MKRSTKAAMLSALLYPGAGHWYLARRWSALFFMLAATAALYVLMSSAWSQANLIAEKILSGEVALEVGSLLNQMSEQGSVEQSEASSVATIWLAVVWFAGIVDAWRVGRTAPDQ